MANTHKCMVCYVAIMLAFTPQIWAYRHHTDIKSIKKAIMAQHEHIENLAYQYNETQHQLKKIELLIANIQNHQQRDHQAKVQAMAITQTLQSEKQIINEQMQAKRDSLSKLLRLLYMHHQPKSLAWIVDPTNHRQWETANHYLRFIVTAIVKRHEALSKLDRDLTAVDRALLAQKTTEKTINQRAREQTRLLHDMRQDRAYILRQMAQQLNQAKGKLHHLIKEKSLLASAIERIEPTMMDSQLPSHGTLAELKGKLPWPVSGHICHHFKQGHGAHKHTHVLISTDEPVNVRAIAPGRVVFSDWLPLYGLVIIIKHAGDYLSIYGHNAILYKKQNDLVSAHSIISKTGDSGGQKHIGLYFEMRSNNQPINPEKWCKS